MIKNTFIKLLINMSIFCILGVISFFIITYVLVPLIIIENRVISNMLFHIIPCILGFAGGIMGGKF